MKILITGVCGLIGSHLAEELISMNHEVIGVDNLTYGSIKNLKNIANKENFKFINCDVRCIDVDSFVSNNQNIDVVYHLAAYKKSYKSKSKMSVVSSDVMLNNVDMTKSIIALVMKSNCHLIFTSTSDVYGNSKNFLEDESITIGPPTVERYSYALSKLFDEQLFLNLVSENKLKCSITRIFGCFSERSNPGLTGGHIPYFIDLAKKDKDITIHGSGNQTRSMIYVDEIVDGLIKILENKESLNGEIVNLGTNEEVSVLESARMVIKMCNSKSKIVFVEGSDVYGEYKEIKRRYANTSKALRLLNWSPKSFFKDSLRNVINNKNKQKR